MTQEILDELIHRFEEGDRSPELIHQLNEAAWTGFHDPWESTPQVQTEAQTEESPMEEEPFDMEAVRPFTLETIERFLQSKEWHVWRHPNDMLMVHFRYDPDTDRESQLVFSLEGKNGTQFRMQWTGDRRVDAERFDQAYRLCNQWNDFARWPRAYLETPPREDEGEEEKKTEMEPASGILAMDFQLPLGKGIHQALFNDLVQNAISTGWGFWAMAHDQYGL